MSRTRILTTLLTTALLALMAAPAVNAAEPAPGWMIDTHAQPTRFTAGDASGNATYVTTATNVGAGATDGTDVTLTHALPAGLTATDVEFYSSMFGFTSAVNFGFLCSTAPETASCTWPSFVGPVAPGAIFRMVVHVAVDPSASGELTSTATISGGGTSQRDATVTNSVGNGSPDFGVDQLGMAFTGADGDPERQAGGHPYQLTTRIVMTNVRRRGASSPNNVRPYTVEDPRNVVVDLPLGFLGSALAAPTCTQQQLTATTNAADANDPGCPPATEVGFIRSFPVGDTAVVSPLVNMVPEKGYAAQFGYIDVLNGVHVMYARVALTPDGYVLRTIAQDVPQALLTDLIATFYGVPALRNNSGQSPVAMFTNPTDCSAGALKSTVHVDSWQNPGRKLADGSPDLGDPRWKSTSTTTPEVLGCNKLRFDSSMSLKPDTTVANSPAGVDVTIRVPQNTNPESLATPPLKKAVVTLPEGVSVNPGAADGLGACSPAQIDLGSTVRPACPASSKIGTVELETPLLGQTLKGSIYLASQNDNPFNTLLAAYIVVDDPETGVVIKIPGRMDADSQTGRLVGTFDNNPQFPFSELRLRFKGGPRGVLATPRTCGSFGVSSVFTPWSAPDSGPAAEASDSFDFSSGCQSGFAPTFMAGSQSPRAGASSPFVLSLARSDTDEELSALKVGLPQGLLAKLAGVPLCPDGDAAAGSCPAASQVGSVRAGSGPGSSPLFLPGKAYLTGPYKGAPYGLAVAVPAKAGPFDLGMVVVRQALHVDPTDAHVTAVSDPFPTILEGIPLRVRRVDVAIDRPGFMLNPTSCDAKQIASTLTSTKGTESNKQTPFQVGDCARLSFTPKLALRLTGKRETTTGRHPGVRAQVTQGGGQAGIDKAVVALPKALALDPDNAQALCEYEDGIKPDLENHCPKGSIVGRAKAITPLLDKPLSGNVYFVKNVRIDKRTGNQIRTLPMIVVALRGEIAINLKGKSSTTRGGQLVNTFASVPDAPVTKFNLNIGGGKNGILTVTRTAKSRINLCNATRTAEVDLDGHNGKQADFTTRVKTPCARKAKKAKRK